MTGQELLLTGERTLPGISRENYWFQRHLVAYERAAAMAIGRRVIDIGCGEGYGPSMLARVADEVLGVDIAPQVVEHAALLYPAGNLSFRVMDVNSLEVPDESFGLAVSFQVVEHLVDVSGYFRELGRVLRPGGTALITTPNRLTISPGCDRPINPFHLREYTPEELEQELCGYFEDVSLDGMYHARLLRLNDTVRLLDFIKVYEMSRLNPRLWAHRAMTPLVRTRDFRLKDGDISDCLDIFATCRKAR